MATRYPRAIEEDDPVKLKEFEESRDQAIAEIIAQSNRQADELEKKCRVTRKQMESEYTI